MTDVDVVVVGLGPGGESVATQLAQAGLSVVAVDRRLVGGECPYYGCIPSKMVIRAADVLAEGRRIPDFAGQSTVTSDWAPVHARIRDEATTDWDDQIAVDRLKDAGAEVVHGEARLTGPRTVEVNGTTYTAAKGVVLNTGTDPSAPADRRARGHAVLDEPRRAPRRGGARLARRGRRRADRRRAGAGVLPLRRAGHGARGGRPHPRPRRSRRPARSSRTRSPRRASRC